MSVDDFCRCTPSEFTSILMEWSDYRQAIDRGHWERVRMESLIALQPWAKAHLKPTDIMHFPWDKECRDGAGVADDDATTTEEKRRRFEKVKKKLGLE